MNVLVDTSVWVAHFRQTNPELVTLLVTDRVLTHPLVILELACGTPPAPRQQTLQTLGLLAQAKLPTTQELHTFIERERLYGLGCGIVDLTLLAATLITPETRLWTMDKRLAQLAQRFGREHLPDLH